MLKSISYLCSKAFGDLMENVDVEAEKHQLDTRGLNLDTCICSVRRCRYNIDAAHVGL